MGRVRLKAGAFAGEQADLLSEDGDTLRVRVTVFGRSCDVSVKRAEVESLDADPRPGLREQVRTSLNGLTNLEIFSFWSNLADTPEGDALAELSEFKRHEAAVRAAGEERAQSLLAAFDATFADVSPSEVVALFEADRLRWMPSEARRQAARAAHEVDPVAGERERARFDVGLARQARADAAAVEYEYNVWRRAVEPSVNAVAQRRHDASQYVEERRERVAARVLRDWGLSLPDHFFHFHSFWRSLGDEELLAMEELELAPFGLDTAVFDDPEVGVEGGLDPRLVGRYFRDPPEFLTVLHGGSDGLHFGLWYDTPAVCAGVCWYYNNDGVLLEPPRGTLLSVLGERLEARLSDEARTELVPGHLRQSTPEDTARRFRLRLLREALLAFESSEETENRHEEETKSYRSSDPARLATVDGAGLVARGTTVESRVKSNLAALFEMTKRCADPDYLHSRVEQARDQCVAGDPTEALALGRDLHWTASSEGMNKAARELLVMAYEASGHKALAEIVRVHHQYRSLPQVPTLVRRAG